MQRLTRALFSAMVLCTLTLPAHAQFSFSQFQGTWNAMPDFNALTPVRDGFTDQIDIGVSTASDNFGLLFARTIEVPVSGDYFFQTTSDDGSRVYIGQALVVDNDGIHAPRTVTSRIFLAAGIHFLRVEFFERGGGEVLDVKYRFDGGVYAPIPSDGRLVANTTSPAETGQWGRVIPWGEIAISAANLPDGRILTFSSTETDRFPANREFTHASVFDPATETFTPTDSNFHDMFCAGVSMVEDGRVIASGGNPDDSRTSAFSPGSLTWSPLTDMNDRRWYGTNITLPDNDIFSTFAKSAGNRSERFDVETGQWATTPNATMQTLLSEQNAINAVTPPPGNTATTMQWYAHLAVMPNGRVFHGGPGQTFHTMDPAGGAGNASLGRPIGDRARMFGNAVTYDVGKVLMIGGADRRKTEATSTSDVYIVDLNGPSPSVTPGAPMNFARALSNSVTLPNGEVLVIGGSTRGQLFSDAGSILETEIYNPASNQWRITAPMDVPRNYHSTALLLKDGRVLAAGGGACGNCATNHQDGQIFSPPYLFDANGNDAPRPTLSGLPAQIGAGQTFAVNTSGGATRFSMVRLSATTHHMNTDQRYVPVASQAIGGNRFNLTMNGNPNVLLPGYYWLYAINANGTPSIGQTIQVLRDAGSGPGPGPGPGPRPHPPPAN
ncbi:MAG: galactose oxidase-like domain-containing protein [Pseudomonadota bacterium]